jgi:transposase
VSHFTPSASSSSLFFYTISSMAKVTDDKRNNVRKHLEDGLSVRAAARAAGVSYGTAIRVRKNKVLTPITNSMGRPSLLNTRMKQYCVRAITKDECENAVQVKKKLEEDHGMHVSVSTVRRALKEAGLVAFVKPKKPAISERNRIRRLAWARAHQFWTMEDWKRVIWSDEFKINRYGSDGKNYAWKRPQEDLQPKHVQQTIKAATSWFGAASRGKALGT